MQGGAPLKRTRPDVPQRGRKRNGLQGGASSERTEANPPDAFWNHNGPDVLPVTEGLGDALGQVVMPPWVAERIRTYHANAQVWRYDDVSLSAVVLGELVVIVTRDGVEQLVCLCWSTVMHFRQHLLLRVWSTAGRRLDQPQDVRACHQAHARALCRAYRLGGKTVRGDCPGLVGRVEVLGKVDRPHDVEPDKAHVLLGSDHDLAAGVGHDEVGAVVSGLGRGLDHKPRVAERVGDKGLERDLGQRRHVLDSPNVFENLPHLSAAFYE